MRFHLADEATYSSHDITFSPDSTVIGWLARQKRGEFDRRTASKQILQLTAPEERLNEQVTCGPETRLVLRTVQPGVGFRLVGFAPEGSGCWREAWGIGPAPSIGTDGLVGTSANRFIVWEGRIWHEAEEPKRLVIRSSLTGEELAAIEVTTGFIARPTTPPDGSLVVGFRDSSLYLWRPGEKIRKIRTGTLRHYRSLAFHPSGRYLLAGNNDATARLIDTETWQIAKQFTWDIGRLTAVAISPDGMLAAAGGNQGRVVVWDLDV
jgi:WD40 repeat protein